MRDDRGLDRADLDRFLTTEPEETPVLPLVEQATLTANALRQMANGNKVLSPVIRTILREHAADLERSVSHEGKAS